MRSSIYLPVSAAEKIRMLKPAAGNHTAAVVKSCILLENIAVVGGLRSADSFPVRDSSEQRERVYYTLDQTTENALKTVMAFYGSDSKTAAFYIAVVNTAAELLPEVSHE